MVVVRKWNPSKQEIEFENLLYNGGYDIVEIKEYKGKTKYKVAKDGVEYNGYFDLYLDRDINVQKRYEFLVSNFNMYQELVKLREEVNND